MDKRSQIAHVAYEKWRQRGCPDGSAEADWSAAEREIADADADADAPDETREIDDFTTAK